MPEPLPSEELPHGFVYPEAFRRIDAADVVAPWWLLEGEHVLRRQRGLAARYPDRNLVVFARRQDNDDVAAFDVDAGSIVVIHDFASPGHEQRDSFADLDSWLERVADDGAGFDDQP